MINMMMSLTIVMMILYFLKTNWIWRRLTTFTPKWTCGTVAPQIQDQKLMFPHSGVCIRHTRITALLGFPAHIYANPHIWTPIRKENGSIGKLANMGLSNLHTCTFEHSRWTTSNTKSNTSSMNSSTWGSTITHNIYLSSSLFSSVLSAFLAVWLCLHCLLRVYATSWRVGVKEPAAIAV